MTAGLLGGAVGELVGYPVDRLTRAQIIAELGGPVTGPGCDPQVADGTQLTLFTVEGYIRARLRWEDRGLCDPRAVVWRAYLRWAYTQGLPYTPDTWFDSTTDSWLLTRRELWHTAELSPRCRRTISQAEHLPTMDHPPNRSDGSGAIMRVAAAGLATSDPDHAVELAVWLAVLTHGHPRAHAASAAYAAVVCLLASGESLDAAIEGAAHGVRTLPGADGLGDDLREALAMDPSWSDDAARRRSLGRGLTSRSALLHAIANLATTDSYADAVLSAANHDGASATPAALTGQLAALLYGIDSIPRGWRTACPVTGLIVELADDWHAIWQGAGLGHVHHKGYLPT